MIAMFRRWVSEVKKEHAEDRRKRADAWCDLELVVRAGTRAFFARVGNVYTLTLSFGNEEYSFTCSQPEEVGGAIRTLIDCGRIPKMLLTAEEQQERSATRDAAALSRLEQIAQRRPGLSVDMNYEQVINQFVVGKESSFAVVFGTTLAEALVKLR
jgi:hypothetical protein